MKILQLNVWMGKVEGNLRRFLESNEFDVICMQEVFASSDRTGHLSYLCFDLSRIQDACNMPFAFFSPNWSFDMAGGSCSFGNLILSHIPIIETHSEFTSGEYHEHVILGTPSNCLNIQIAKLENGFTVVNHHGFWRPDPMGDDDTIKAFTKVGQIVRRLDNGPLVMCGDLNIVHDSPAMRPLDFLRDLTHDHNIKTTLSGLKYDGEVACDHILVNEQVKVQDFTVYPDLVSDHLALSANLEVA